MRRFAAIALVLAAAATTAAAQSIPQAYGSNVYREPVVDLATLQAMPCGEAQKTVTRLVMDIETLYGCLDDGGGFDWVNLGAVASSVSCTDCLGTVEIQDVYLLNSGDTSTGVQHTAAAGVLIPEWRSSDESAVQLVLRTASTNRRIVAADAGGTTESQITLDDAGKISFSGQTLGADDTLVLEASGATFLQDVTVHDNTSNLIFKSTPLGTHTVTLNANISDSTQGGLNVKLDGVIVVNHDDSFSRWFDGGVEAMRFTGGDLGIGTTVPDADLHVVGTGGVTARVSATDASSAKFETDSEQTAAGLPLGRFQGRWSGTVVGRMEVQAGDDTVAKDDGDLLFRTAQGGVLGDVLRLHQEGHAEFFGSVEIGTGAGPSVLHVKDGDAGAYTPHAQGDTAVFEAAATGGISIAGPDTAAVRLLFGSPSDNLGAHLTWVYDDGMGAGTLEVGTNKTGAVLFFTSGTGLAAMELDGSQDAKFYGTHTTLGALGGTQDVELEFADGASSDQQVIDFNSGGTGPPTSTDGWKLRLHGDGSYDANDYGIGIGTTDTLWINGGATWIRFKDQGTNVGGFYNDLFVVGPGVPNYDLEVEKSESGGKTSISITNTATAADSHAELFMSVNGSVAGNPHVRFNVSGLSNFYVGQSNQLTNDPFVIDTNANMLTPMFGIERTGSGDAWFGALTGSTSQVHILGGADDTLLVDDGSGACEARPTTGSMTWSCTSDERLKSFIRPPDPVFEELAAIPLHTYEAFGQTMMGPVAQELIEIRPDLVTMGDNGYFRVATLSHWKLVRALQLLIEQNRRIRERLDSIAKGARG